MCPLEALGRKGIYEVCVYDIAIVVYSFVYTNSGLTITRD